jgi:acyl carrier protein
MATNRPKSADSHDGVRVKVRTFIVRNFLFGDEADWLSDDESLLERGVIDSTGILELIEFIQREFEITIADDEVLPANLDSLAAIERYVASKNQVEPAPGGIGQ